MNNGFEISEPERYLTKRHNAYRTLGIPFYSSIEKSKSGLIEKAKQIDHSSKSAEQELLNLNLAYQEISDPERKKEYDIVLAMKDPSIKLISHEPFFTPLALARSMRGAEPEDIFNQTIRGVQTPFGEIIPKSKKEEWEGETRGILFMGNGEITLTLKNYFSNA